MQDYSEEKYICIKGKVKAIWVNGVSVKNPAPLSTTTKPTTSVFVPPANKPTKTSDLIYTYFGLCLFRYESVLTATSVKGNNW